ncbi:MAG: S-layer homology domain-containing protein [Clostridia bacterium]
MTNLKKVIALTLASSLALSSVASAAFTDTADVADDDAITTLSALSIINGYDDGTFRPDNTVTRGEMAKMIFTIKNGGSDDASAFEGIYTEFTDVEGHWASGYIKFCENTGIIAGYTDGTFLPDAEVTGVEALKMALVALGYNAEKAGLEGTYWSQNTISKAVLAGLTDDVTNFAADCTRENAAQILYNALYADMVKWDVDSEDFVDKYTLYTTTLAEDALNLVEYEGVVSAIGEDSVTIERFDDDQVPMTSNNVAVTKKFEAFEDYTENMGSYVTVLANSDSEVFGLKVDSDTLTVIDYIDNLDDDGEDTDYEVYDDNDNTIEGFTQAAYDLIDNANAYDKVIIAQNDFANADNEYVIVTVIPTNIGEVRYAGSEYISVQLSAYNTDLYSKSYQSFYYDDEIIDDGIDTDDCWVEVTYSKFLDCAVVEILEEQTGTVDATKYVAGSTGATSKHFSIDGTYYAVTSGDSADYPSFGDEITFVAIDNYIFWITDVSSDVDVDDYIFVADVASAMTKDDGTSVSSGINYWNVVIIDTEGNESTVKIASEDADGDADDYDAVYDEYTAPALGLYTYDTDDDYYMLTGIVGADFDDCSEDVLVGTDFDEDDGEIKSLPISDDAIFFVTFDTDDYDMVTGAEVKAWSEDDLSATDTFDVYLMEGSSSFEEIVLGYIVIDSDELPGAAEKLYGYVTSSPYYVEIDGDDYITFKVFNGEEDVRYYAEGKLSDYTVFSKYLSDGSSTTATFAADDVICYSIDSTDGDYTFVTIEDVTKGGTYDVFVGAVQAYSDSYVRFYSDVTTGSYGPETRYTIEDDTYIIYVDTDEADGIVGGSMTKAYQVEDENDVLYYQDNAFVVINSADEIVAIFFDVNSDYIDGATNYVYEK